MRPAEEFCGWLAAQPAPTVVEVGTRRSDPAKSTHHAAWVPDGGRLVMVDAFDGLDVDVVDDAEVMANFADGEADAIVCVSTLEHIPRPWRALEAFARILAPGGHAYVATHQSFPLHGYPSDYFRFSGEAMALMGTDAGLWVVSTGYEYPAKIVPPREVTVWNTAAPVWLNVAAHYSKPVM